MIDKIKMFFNEHMKLSSPDQLSTDNLRVACAALLLEMMTMDDRIDSNEQQAVLSLLTDQFSLTSEQANALVDLASQERDQATDYFQFTSLINKQYTQDQKKQLIESLWKIAYVDGVLDMNEEYLVRKIADLLYVPHVDLIKTKLRVQDSNNNSSH
jgi:uncharacterized tellurite resistance protein B-like protein